MTEDQIELVLKAQEQIIYAQKFLILAENMMGNLPNS
jgi:hypothetical protein